MTNRMAHGTKSKGKNGRDIMRRNMIFLILCATLFALCAFAEAQQERKFFV